MAPADAGLNVFFEGKVSVGQSREREAQRVIDATEREESAGRGFVALPESERAIGFSASAVPASLPTPKRVRECRSNPPFHKSLLVAVVMPGKRRGLFAASCAYRERRKTTDNDQRVNRY